MNQPTPVAEAKVQTRSAKMGEVVALFTTRLPLLKEALGSERAAQRFKRVVITAIQQNPELLECQPLSLWNASMKCANAGHLPDGRDAALVVFKDKNLGKVAQHLPMRLGITKQILKSPEISTLHTAVVHANDEWLYEEGDTPIIKHKPTAGNPGDVIAAYSVARFKDGGISREWMWRRDIDKARAVAKTQNVWNQWFDEMCRKTVLKRHSKSLPMTNDTEQMLVRDDEISFGEGEVDQALLAHKPDEPTGEPFDADTGELGGEDRFVQGELIDQPKQEQRKPEGTHEADRPPEENERLRHVKLLNDAATTGMLDRVYARFTEHWKKELEPQFQELQNAKGKR